MKLKTLRPVAAALIVASLAPAAIAETLADHPAVQVARTWSTRGIDPNTFIVGHPAGLQVPTVASNSVAVSGTSRSTPSSYALDAQASAAALLSGSRALRDSRHTRELSSKLER